MFSQLTVSGVGERPEVGRLFLVLGIELDEPVGRGKRARTEGERVNGTERRGVQPDAECEDENGRGREAGTLAQRARSMTNVPEKLLGPDEASLVATLLLHLRESAEFALRGIASFFGRQTILGFF